MNGILDRATDTTHDDNMLQVDRTTTESIYTTTPIVAIKPIYYPANEEELHTSFEKAISSRQLALQNRLSRLSNPILANIQCAKSNTDSLISSTPTLTSSRRHPESPSHIIPTWQRATILICLTLIVLVLCCDFAALLAFHIH